MNRKSSLLLLCISAIISNTQAQKKIVIMGSSTAAGRNATVYDSSWVGKLELYYKQNSTDGKDTIITNIAVSGYTTYHEMPTDFVPPISGRPLPDPEHNLTKALSYNPDIVIINLPTNDVILGYSKKEFLNNLRAMYQMVRSTGASCYITTPQPRNDAGIYNTDTLRTLVDSVEKIFGFYSINFWTDLATPDGYIKPEVDARDAIHINNLGHHYLYLRVQSKQIFSSNIALPLTLTEFRSFKVNNSVVIQWQTAWEESNTSFDIQRSGDSQNFQSIHRQPALAPGQGRFYSWTDKDPLPGKSYYRLKITETNRQSFSKIVSIINKSKELAINKVYKSNTTILLVDVYVQKKQQALISVMTAAGQVVLRQSQIIISPSKIISVPIGRLGSGQYFISVDIPGSRAVVAFNK